VPAGTKLFTRSAAFVSGGAARINYKGIVAMKIELGAAPLGSVSSVI
jgi:hypothetical protein